MLRLQSLVLAHHLRNRLNRRERVLHFMRDGRGHLTQRGQPLPFRQAAFELDIRVSQTAILDGDGNLAGEHLKHRPHIIRQSVGRGFDQH